MGTATRKIILMSVDENLFYELGVPSLPFQASGSLMGGMSWHLGKHLDCLRSEELSLYSLLWKGNHLETI